MSKARKRTKQIAWFCGLWLFGVLSVGLVTGLIRLVMRAVQ